jgi:hypothetical protein
MTSLADNRYAPPENMKSAVRCPELVEYDDITLKWKASPKTRAALKHQAKMSGQKNATHYLLDIIKERLAFDENDSVLTQEGELLHDC